MTVHMTGSAAKFRFSNAQGQMALASKFCANTNQPPKGLDGAVTCDRGLHLLQRIASQF